MVLSFFAWLFVIVFVYFILMRSSKTMPCNAKEWKLEILTNISGFMGVIEDFIFLTRNHSGK